MILRVYSLFCTISLGKCTDNISITFLDGKSGEYCIRSTLFCVSEVFREMVVCCTEQSDDPIQLGFTKHAFDIVIDLFGHGLKHGPIGSPDLLAEVLRLVDYLVISDGPEKAVLYRNLARESVGSQHSTEIIATCIKTYDCVPHVEIYMLDLLRGYASLHCVDVRVSSNTATLCPECSAYSEFGNRNSVSSVTRMNILPTTLNKIRKYSKNVFNIFIWFFSVMDVPELCVDNCFLGSEEIACIASRLRCLSKLSMKSCNLKPGSIAHLSIARCLNDDVCVSRNSSLNNTSLTAISKLISLAKPNKIIAKLKIGVGSTPVNLECLTELDVSWNMWLNKSDISAIARLRTVTKLSLGGCNLDPGYIASIASNLKHLDELCVSGNKLDKRDVSAISRLGSLAKLDMSYCNLEFGCLSLLNGLLNLTDLDIHENKLDKRDVSTTFKIKSLKKLNIGRCDLKLGSIACIVGDLNSLTELYASGNSLDQQDVLAIAKLGNLTKLSIGCCKLMPGNVAHIANALVHLTELYASGNSLDQQDVLAIAKLRNLIKLSIGCCNLIPGSVTHIANALVHLTELYASGNSLDQQDVLAIAKLKNLTKLSLGCCKLIPGSVAHITNDLNHLNSLYVYGNVLNSDDNSAINDLRSRNVYVYH